MVDKVAMEQGFLRVQWSLPSVIIIPPMLHTHSSITDAIQSSQRTQALNNI